MKKKVLVSGVCGFIFSNFIRYVQNNALYSNYEFVSVDKLVQPYNKDNVLSEHRLHIADIADQDIMDKIFSIERPNIVINAAAETNVDNSIKFAFNFIHSNVLGTQVMVDLSLKYGVERFIQISTDEVYGQLKDMSSLAFIENINPLSPRNPYSASKAAAEFIVAAAHETHGLQYNITRCVNNFGPRQNPQNLVPKIITSVLSGQKIPIHGSGLQHREWLYVEDNCSAIMKIAMDAPPNEIYNIGSGKEMPNIEMVKNICKIMNISNIENSVKYIEDRKGHDFRYKVDCSKLHELGWKPAYTFEQGIKQCVDWYVERKHMYIGGNN
jgi:dTDP-glucose 4,6-dehydratase